MKTYAKVDGQPRFLDIDRVSTHTPIVYQIGGDLLQPYPVEHRTCAVGKLKVAIPRIFMRMRVYT